MKQNIFLLTLFAILNFISWTYVGILLPIALATLFLYLSNNLKLGYLHFVISTFSILLIFNITGAYWIFYIDTTSFLIALFLNPILLTLLLSLYYVVSLWKEVSISSIILIFISFEYYFNNQEYSFNWLNFGNVLGNQIYFAQLYSSIGTIGGSLFLLIIGYLLFYIYQYKSSKIIISGVLLMSVLPFVYSVYEYTKVSIYEKSDLITIGYLSPEYLSENNGHNLSKKVYKLLKSNSNIDFFVLPETSMQNISMSELFKGKKLPYFRRIKLEFPKTKIIIGSEIKISKKNKVNSLIVMDSLDIIQKVKTKYVPFLEYTPSYLEFSDKTYYMKTVEDNSSEIISKYKFLPLICYESFFSDYIGSYSGKYEFIILLTSESFFGSSNYGREQYLNLIKLKAIESGRFIMKSAYKGISCVINEKGQVVDFLSEHKTTSTLYRIR